MPALTIPFLLLAWLLPGAALAHGDETHERLWTFDPLVVTPWLISGWFYASGLMRLWSRAGRGHGVPLWRAGVYAFGWASLGAALLSPLHWAGEQLFTFHMIEHEIVMAVSAPLLVLGRPVGTALWALPRRVRRRLKGVMNGRALRRLWSWLVRPLNATLLHGLAIWIWHEPHLLDASVTRVFVHRFQHLSFLLTALLFWWALLRSRQHGVAVWHLFLTMMHMSLLGAILALSPRVLYVAQTAHAEAWGLTPLEDQQLAGLIMWAPAGAIYAAAALIFAASWISRGRYGRPASTLLEMGRQS